MIAADCLRVFMSVENALHAHNVAMKNLYIFGGDRFSRIFTTKRGDLKSKVYTLRTIQRNNIIFAPCRRHHKGNAATQRRDYFETIAFYFGKRVLCCIFNE